MDECLFGLNGFLDACDETKCYPEAYRSGWKIRKQVVWFEVEEDRPLSRARRSQAGGRWMVPRSGIARVMSSSGVG